MNYKENRGYTGVDISIALVILLIFIPTIGSIIYNIQKTNNSIKRQSNAVSIATNILETAKQTDYDKVILTNNTSITDDFIDQINKIYKTPNISSLTENKEIEFGIEGEDSVRYKINLKLINYTDTEEFQNYHSQAEEPKNVLKKLTVTIIYTEGKDEKSINISTLIKKND